MCPYPLLVVALFALPAPAQSLKLNAPLARGVDGLFTLPVTSSDGEHLVYTIDREGDGDFEIDSIASSGKDAPVRLSGPVDLHADVRISPDGKRVLYLADLDANGSRDLAVAPIDGHAPPRALHPAPVAGGNVQWIASITSERAVYLADQETDEVLQLFSVHLTSGAAPVELNGALVAGGDVQGTSFSRYGRLLVYSADQETDEVVELFVVPTDGSIPARKLDLPLVPGGDVAAFQLDSTGSRVLYIADQEEDERFELFSVLADGSQPPLKLNGTLVPGGDVGPTSGVFFFPDVRLSFDDRWVVYIADQDTDERFELFSVPADGSGPAVKLSTASDLDVGSWSASYGYGAVSYDSAWVLYLSRPSGTNTVELSSVPIDGSGPSRRISGPMAPGGSAFFPQVSRDSARVAYVADQDVDGVDELYSAPIDGSAPPVKLNAPLPPGGDVAVERANLLPGFWVTEGGVMYEAEQERDGLNELYFVPITGGVAPRKLAAGPVRYPYPSAAYRHVPPEDFGLVLFERDGAILQVGIEPGARPIVLDRLARGRPLAGVDAFELAASSERVIYSAQEEADEVRELYSVALDERLEHAQLHPDLPPSAFVRGQRLTPDGSRVVFFARLGSDQPLELYGTLADGNGPLLRLNASLGPSDFVIGPDSVAGEVLAMTADGLRVVFLASVAGSQRIFAARIDGTEPAVDLSQGTSGVPAPGMKISANGAEVAFLNERQELFAVPLDGSSLPRRVSSLQQIVENDFQLTPQGERVVFRTRAFAGGKGELFVAPSDASAPPTRLSAESAPDRDVIAFALALDGVRAVYRSNENSSLRNEIFSVPVDASSAPVRLNAPLAVGENVFDFAIAPDGRNAVYRAGSAARLELTSVAIDAGQPPVRLSAGLAGGIVLEYRISADEGRVVYRARQDAGQPVALFSVPIRMPRGVRRLDQPQVPGGGVGSFRISADGSTVVFAAERNAAQERTLLVAPIHGRKRAVEVAGPFAGAGSVIDYRISADGAVVVYRADQDERFTYELYAARNTTVEPRASQRR